MAHITCWEGSPILSPNIPVGFFVKRATLGYYIGHNKIGILCPTQGKTG